MTQSEYPGSGTDNDSRGSNRESKLGGAGTQQATAGDSGMSFDEGKGKAAGALRDVAHLMRDRAGGAPLPGADRAADAAARPLESGAEYLEQHTPADMWSDVMEFCRAHPAGALFLGFSLGYMVKKVLP